MMEGRPLVAIGQKATDRIRDSYECVIELIKNRFIQERTQVTGSFAQPIC